MDNEIARALEALQAQINGLRKRLSDSFAIGVAIGVPAGTVFKNSVPTSKIATNYKGAIFRKSAKDLADWHAEAERLYLAKQKRQNNGLGR